MIGRLLRKILDQFVKDISPAQDACESCPDSLALHCTNEKAATCKVRLDAIESAKGKE